MDNSTKYPRFISNHPCGKDLFLGKSQERIAKAIQEHIQKGENANLEYDKNRQPHIIGLEGGWGSGKSNLIRILSDNYFKDTHYVFEYDAWGHQEDLQRRTFLETLTAELLKKNILPEITSKAKRKNKVKWTEKLEDLLSRKRKTNTKTNPKLSLGIITSIFFLIISPITASIAEGISSRDIPSLFWTSVFYLVPFLILLSYFLICILYKKKSFADFFVVYNGGRIKDTINETISEKEPSVAEFNKWMNDLSNDLQKKLIIVYDNMDRLPAHKVKELWSSIHSFFAESFYGNIWVIIPFDRNHLANAFGKTEFSEAADIEEAKKLTTHFINKTFPVIYRVAAPIFSDYKSVFNYYLEEAFGKNSIPSQEKETIVRIFEIIKQNPTIREIIAFINELVLQKKTWGEEIKLLHIAIFTLRKEKIINDKENSIAENIISNNYCEDIQKLIDDEAELQESISALAYNINKKDAGQISLMQALKSLFINKNNQSDINSFYSKKYFVEILFKVIRDVDSTLVNRVIIKTNELETSEFKKIEKDTLKEIWSYLTSLKIDEALESLTFSEEYKILLIKGNSNDRKRICEYLCEEFQTYKERNGKEYYETMAEFRDFLKKQKIDFDIQSEIKEISESPENFINYVESAKEEYKEFKITCDEDVLNKHLIGLLPDEMKYKVFFDYLLSDDSYNLEPFYIELKKHILESTNNNFCALNHAYKLLSPEKFLEIQLTVDQVAELQNTITKKDDYGYFDISAMALGHGNSINIDPEDDETIEEIATRIEHYHNYGSLLKLLTITNDSVLARVLVKLTKTSYGMSKLSIENILPIFEEIISRLNIDSKILLKRLDAWSRFAKKEINKDNIEEIIEHTFYKHSVGIENDLTIHIHDIAKERLSEIEVDALFASKIDPQYYWLVVAQTFIDGKILKSLPHNLVDFAKKIFIHISDTSEMPNEVVLTIIKKIHHKKITVTIKNIVADYCQDRKIISPQLFLFFEEYFRQDNRVKGKEGDFTRTILTNVVDDNQCREHILEHNDYYVDVIEKAKEDAEDFKAKIININKREPTEKLTRFAELIKAESIDDEVNEVEQ